MSIVRHQTGMYNQRIDLQRLLRSIRDTASLKLDVGEWQDIIFFWGMEATDGYKQQNFTVFIWPMKNPSEIPPTDLSD